MKRTPSRAISVLVVDDEELVRKFVERVLREAGYTTATAADGPEAIRGRREARRRSTSWSPT